MFRKFLILQWKTATRSPMWQKSIVLNLVIGFFLLLFALDLMMLGIFLDKIFEEMAPDRNPFELLNGVIAYYLMADLLIRFMMQTLPRMNIESYTHLPIRKNKIIHFMEGRTIYDIFNFLPLLIFLPVTFTIVIPEAGHRHALVWLVSVLCMILGNNFFATWLKRMLGVKPFVVAGIAVLFAALFILEKLHLISLMWFSSKVFGYITVHPLFVILPLLWMATAYLIHYRFLSVHLYPDEIQKKKNIEVHDGPANEYLKSLGLTGTIITLELKLYWRNKRTRTMVYMLPVFLLYGLMFYPNREYKDMSPFLMFVGVFMTGGLMLNYANYTFAYESVYFDTLMTKNIDFRQYIRTKFYVAVLISTVCYILTIPYVLFGYKILLINTAMYFYNIGILVFVLLYFSTYNKKRMDLSRGGAFNYQGIGAMNWLAVMPAFILPVLIYLPFKLTGYPLTGVLFTGLTGITGLFFSRSFIFYITRNFYRRKYIMAASFRERS